MKIRWLAHSSFLITTGNGTRIITDPYTVNDKVRYGEVKGPADIVTVSHEHGDHNNVAPVGGKPQIIKVTAEAKGIRFRGIPVYHDEQAGSQRGKDTIFCFEADGIKTCHLGDLGHVLTPSQMAEIGKIDVLLIPVGGFYTIDAKAATKVCDQLKPRVIIPMHFKTPKLDFPIVDAEDFLKGRKNVKKVSGSEVEFKSPAELPVKTQVIVLQPSL